MSALAFEGVGRAYGTTRVLSNIDLTVPHGHAFALVGRSGLGKTTLLRIAAGLDRAHEGRVTGAGRVSAAFQEPRLLPWASALRNVTLATGVSPERARDLLAAVEMEHLADNRPNQLSLGQQRRVSFVRALAPPADTLLLDEPFASLDPQTTRILRRRLRAVIAERRTTVLLVTHDPADVEGLCDGMATLEGVPVRLTSLEWCRPARTA